MSTEQQLRELFAADAAGAPGQGGLAAGALRKVRRRRARIARATGLVAAVVAVGGVAVTWGPAETGGPTSVVTDAAPPTGEGALTGNVTEDCTGYSPARFAERLTEPGFFALDGTVTAVRLGPDLGPEMPDQYAVVTFEVHTWYQGGSGESVDVYLDAPHQASLDSDIASYGIGTRLLVSGVLAGTEGVSKVLTAAADEGFFGFTCGYTRYYDAATAAEWIAATD